MPRPCKLTFDLLTLEVVSESCVTWATFVPILVFLGLSVFDLGPMYATDRRQTSNTHHRVMPSPYGGGGIIRAPSIKERAPSDLGRMSSGVTKPGSICPLSYYPSFLLSVVSVFFHMADFKTVLVYLVVFRVLYLGLLVVLVWLSVIDRKYSK